MRVRSSLVPRRRSALRAIAPLIVVALLAACGRPKTEANQPPVAIKKGDTCVVCGMYITNYPGPRGEAYLSGVSKVLKMGSTRDFFAYVTRPDVSTRLESAYVQDTAHIDWAHPSNSAKSFIDARKAYYVAWQPLPGAMGPTFAPFAKRGDAEAFIQVHGGAVLRFNQITSALTSGLTYTCPASASRFYRLATEAKCVTKTGAAPPPGMSGGPSGGMVMPSKPGEAGMEHMKNMKNMPAGAPSGDKGSR